MVLPSLTCGGGFNYRGNAYRLSMAQNHITVLIGEHIQQPFGVCPIGAVEEIELGRLPAGDYTITVIEGPTGMQPGNLVNNAPFTVSDARAFKQAPYVRLDYSGHWWDPNDSGWGLFIWHDARNISDSLLAAWFTYTADGKPIWYVFQPRWQTSTSTLVAEMAQASRPPGATSPPPTVTAATLAGTASLDFTRGGLVEEGTITYTLTGGQRLVRNIQRFKP